MAKDNSSETKRKRLTASVGRLQEGGCMPGRKRKNIQPEDVRCWTKQGYGQGTLECYKPWIKVQDISSRGTSARFLLVTVGCIHRSP